jgi:hypothetical protein
MRRFTRRACLLAALGLCAVAWSQAATGPLRPLAASLRELDAGQIVQALQAMRLRPIRQAWAEFWDIFGPGGRLHPDWFIEHQGHLFIEGGLMAIILVLFFQSGYRPSKEQEEEPLTERVRAAAARAPRAPRLNRLNRAPPRRRGARPRRRAGAMVSVRLPAAPLRSQAAARTSGRGTGPALTPPPPGRPRPPPSRCPAPPPCANPRRSTSSAGSGSRSRLCRTLQRRTACRSPPSSRSGRTATGSRWRGGARGGAARFGAGLAAQRPAFLVKGAGACLCVCV